MPEQAFVCVDALLPSQHFFTVKCLAQNDEAEGKTSAAPFCGATIKLTFFFLYSISFRQASRQECVIQT